MRASACSESPHKARLQPAAYTSAYQQLHRLGARACACPFCSVAPRLGFFVRVAAPVRLQELSLGGNAIGDAGAHHIGNPTRPVGA